MLRNYFIVALRNLTRNKVFSAINLLGLALGLTCSLLILLWIQDERSVGTHYPNGASLYRVYTRQFQDGKVTADQGTPGLLADELKRQFPEVEYAATFSWEEPHLISVHDKVARQNVRYVGADWLRLYGIPLLAGNPASALNSPTGVVLSRKLAEQYFGSPPAALHQTIRLDNTTDYQVTAVFENLPVSAEAGYDFLLSWSGFMTRHAWAREWGNSPVQTRIRLRKDTDPIAFETKIKSFLQERNGVAGADLDIHLFLQPESEAYLYSNLENGYPSGGRIAYVRLFGIVAGFLLLIACINFMNLSTARSARRAREVGVRKVVGAGRWVLFGQFMGESLLLTSLSLLLALIFTSLSLPLFNQLTGKQLVLPTTSLPFWAMLLGLDVLVGIVAGSYPALFLSSLQPLGVLKTTFRLGNGARAFRRGLVVLQFILSMLLIVGTVVVYWQLNYVQTKNLGYERENLLYVPLEGELATSYEAFKQALLQMPGIESVTQLQNPLLGLGNSSTGGISWPGKAPNDHLEFKIQATGYDLVKTLKLSVRGRDFSPAFGTDSTNYLINEAAASRLGYADPLGQPLTQWNRSGRIIGVLKDFHYGSLHQPIEPLIIRLDQAATYQVMIRTQPGQTKAALTSLESLYRRMNPKVPFSYQFADEEYQKLYQNEQLVGTLANLFAGLATFIACLGLLGLTAFTVEQRRKEIGVRKVLGASITSIVTLLSKELLQLVLLAIVMAAPIAYYAGHQWLAHFAYKITLNGWIFALAGLVALLIALLTVSFQAIKAAIVNPVKSLRTE